MMTHDLHFDENQQLLPRLMHNQVNFSPLMSPVSGNRNIAFMLVMDGNTLLSPLPNQLFLLGKGAVRGGR